MILIYSQFSLSFQVELGILLQKRILYNITRVTKLFLLKGQIQKVNLGSQFFFLLTSITFFISVNKGNYHTLRKKDHIFSYEVVWSTHQKWSTVRLFFIKDMENDLEAYTKTATSFRITKFQGQKCISKIIYLHVSP